jgi:predicted phosphodiesterase
LRLGILSDIHANLPALDAVVRALERRGIDRYVCLGDIVGYGPFPEECLARVRELTTDVVAGNHELLVLDPRAMPGAPAAVLTTLSWTRSTLGVGSRYYISCLPLTTFPAPGVLATHGSLAGPDDYVWAAAHARQQLARLEIEHPDVGILLVGHTHRAMAYAQRRGLELHGGRGVVRLAEHERALLNPGALGQSRQWSPHARAMVVDLERKRAEFWAVPYDRGRLRVALRERRLAPRAYHHRPGPVDAAADGLRELRRAMRRRRASRRGRGEAPGQ